ncbi:unnamed protein product, partial [Lampetra planeri]
MSSFNFVHALSWQRLDGAPGNATYTVLVGSELGLEEVPGCVSLSSSSLNCSLTDHLGDMEMRYHIREASQEEMELSFAPDENTTLGPPSLTLNVTTLWISGPFVASGRRSGLSVAQVYNTPRYEVSYYTRGEEARE